MFLAFCWLILIAASFASVYAIVRMFRVKASSLPVRRLEDVINLLRAINHTEFESLLDPQHEGRMRNRVSPHVFRQQTWPRLYLASEYVQRLQHNADVLLRWAYDEQFRVPAIDAREYKLRAYLVREIIEAAWDVMRYCAFIRIKLWLWRKLRLARWPIMPIPGSFDLRSSESIDGPSAYHRLVETISMLSLLHGGEQCYEQLMVAVYGEIDAD